MCIHKYASIFIEIRNNVQRSYCVCVCVYFLLFLFPPLLFQILISSVRIFLYCLQIPKCCLKCSRLQSIVIFPMKCTDRYRKWQRHTAFQTKFTEFFRNFSISYNILSFLFPITLKSIQNLMWSLICPSSFVFFSSSFVICFFFCRFFVVVVVVLSTYLKFLKIIYLYTIGCVVWMK